MTLIKSISGIRGVFGHTLNKEIATSYSISFAQNQPKGTILLSRDTRPHGIVLYNSIIKSLSINGFNVLDCGIIPTPTAQFIIKEKKISGGIVITASHNPIEWNGLKFLDSDGCFLNSDKMNTLLKYTPIKKKSKIGKVITLENPYESHINNVLQLNCINTKIIKEKKIKVVVDTVNGAAYKALPIFLQNLNCEVIKIYCDNDGTFPRGTEPIPSHLEHLSNMVIKHNADIGLATDPDADRLAIVDNKGIPIGEELTLILAVESYLKYYRNKQTIVTNLSTSMGVDAIAKKYNSKVERSSVGEINVVEKMKKLGSAIGGEGNGGVIVEESHLGRDSLVASALILNHLAKSNCSLTEIMKNIPNFIMIKDKITLKNDIDLKQIKNQYKAQNDIKFIENDGLKILWKDKWVHIRKSNTEPIVRIISEAKDNETAKELIDSIKSKI